MRHAELTRIGVGDIRDAKLWIQPETGPAATAEPTKGYRARAVPVSKEVVAVLTRFLAWRSDKKGHTAHKHALHRTLRAACKVARVPTFGLHDLRRGFATECVRAGVPLSVVRDWLGHRLTATTERYVGRYRSDADVAPPVPALLAESPKGRRGADKVQSLHRPGVSAGAVRGASKRSGTRA